MKKLLIVIPVASHMSKLPVVRECFNTIYGKVGLKNSDFDLLFYIDDKISGDIKDYLTTLSQQHGNVTRISDMGSWADDVNDAIRITIREQYEYLAVFHDDVFMRSNDWFNTVYCHTSQNNRIGVITSTCTVYRKTCSPMTPCRDGFYSDVLDGAWNRGVAFQFHTLPDNWGRQKFYDEWTAELESFLDYPSGPVQIFSTWSAVMIMKNNMLKEMPKVERWTPWTFLNELDFNLEAMEAGFYNCWIPNLFTEHHRENYVNPSTRSTDSIAKYKSIAHSSFYDKWRFSHEPNRNELDAVKKSLKCSVASEFIDTSNSYDWRYF